MAGPGLDRTGTLTPRQARGFVNPEPACLGPMGGLMSTISHVNSTDAKVLFRSELIPPDVLGLGFNFTLQLAGLISNSGAPENLTLNIDAVEPDGTRTNIAAVVTAGLANEDDKGFLMFIQGRVTLEQLVAVDGKLWATGWLVCNQGTPLYFNGAAALAGVAVTFVNQTYPDLSGIHLEVTGDWGAAHADAQIDVISAILQVCNVPGAPGQGTAP